MNLKEKIREEQEKREPVLLEKINPHITRHTFATRYFECGMDSKVVQEIMEHAHYSTTVDIYTHVMEDKMREECRKFGNDRV